MKDAEAVQLQDEDFSELAPIVRIGTETVLSQYPLHRLAKKTDLEIRMTEAGPRGKVITTWEVSASRKYGEPGPLAYKIDTLLVNRAIDESRPNIPEIIRLGSLREICEALGMSPEGKSTQLVKKALHQNASAYITAKLDYKASDGTERSFEFGASRYEVIFLGQKLPDGTKADAVYIILHRTFREFLSQAKTRPLDYEYLKSLPPAAQRLYELLSFQFFAALKYDNPRAKYLYSDFCRFAPLTRYLEWDKVKKQLYKIHQPHKQSGYISKIEFEEVRGDDGRPDWVMWYTPGRKAKREFREFSIKKAITAPSAPRLVLAPPAPAEKRSKVSALSPEEGALVLQLCEIGIAKKKAHELVRTCRESVEREMDVWGLRDQSKMKDPAAWLIKAIESGDYAKPQKARGGKRSEKATAPRRKGSDALRERLAEEYAGYLSGELESLQTRHEQAYKVFGEEFAAYWDLACRGVAEDERESVRVHFLEKFAEENPALGILTFGQWVVGTREKNT